MKKTFLVFAAASTISGAFWPHTLLSHEVVNTTVTFDREIVRILKRKCLACHSEGNLGMPLTTYEQTRPWSRAIEEELLRRHMPPWRAVPGYGQFANDMALTNRELQFFVAWVEGNGPKTRGQRLIVNIDQGTTRPSDRLTLDFDRWQLGKPDLLKPLAAHSIPAGQGDRVHHEIIDLGLNSERWIRALEFKPRDRRVVRAAFFSLQETGQWLGSWTPWYGVTTLPENTAYRVPAGSHVVAEIHYRSASQPVEDRAALGMYFAQGPAAHSPTDLAVEAKREGASSSPSERFRGSVKIPAAVNLLALKPDVEAGVESVEVSARKPDGTVQVLLLLRDVLPQWPTPYILKEPVPLPKNTELSATVYYNNSAAASPPAGFKVTVSLYNAGAPTKTTH